MSKRGETPQQRRPRKPTRDEKKILKNNKLDWHNWLIAGEDNISYTIQNKDSGKRRVIFK